MGFWSKQPIFIQPASYSYALDEIAANSVDFMNTIRSFILLFCFLSAFIPYIDVSAKSHSEIYKENDIIEIPEILIRRELIRYTPDLYISTESLLNNPDQKKKSILVDVRTKEKFNSFGIPGSINIPLYAIKTKPMLRSQSVVLVNEGFSNHRLEETCKTLRKNGFAASILRGGLNDWKI